MVDAPNLILGKFFRELCFNLFGLILDAKNILDMIVLAKD